MLTVAFWNIQGKNLGDSIGNLFAEHHIDLFFLAEVPTEIETVRSRAAIRCGHPVMYVSQPVGGKCELFLRHPSRHIRHAGLSNCGRMSVFRIDLPDQPVLLVAAFHLPSRSNWNHHSQEVEAARLLSELREIESFEGLDRMIMLGDFNMNPYDPGLIMSSHFHALSDANLVAKGTRTIQGKEYRMSYNPMWSLLGDRTPDRPGTHFRGASEHLNPHWHIFDQFLLTPEALRTWSIHEVRILESDGKKSLATASGRPNKTLGSDHFPILLKLEKR